MEIKPIELFKRFPSLDAKQRKSILLKRDVTLKKTLITIMVRHIKELFCDRYEKGFGRKCIWRWMTRGDSHWRELARNLIEMEQDPERFMEYVWHCKPLQNNSPPLAWMKSILTVERSLSWSPAEIQDGVNWHQSRDYHQRLKKSQEVEVRIEREERGWNASRRG